MSLLIYPIGKCEVYLRRPFKRHHNTLLTVFTFEYKSVEHSYLFGIPLWRSKIYGFQTVHSVREKAIDYADKEYQKVCQEDYYITVVEYYRCWGLVRPYLIWHNGYYEELPHERIV